MQNDWRCNPTARQKAEPTTDSIVAGRKIFKTFFSTRVRVTPVSLLAGLMTVLVFAMPLLSFAQQNPAVAAAIADAERDARDHTSFFSWFTLGCLGGGPITVLTAAVGKPAPPAESLLGKAPGYVEAYTNAYQSKAKSLRSWYATTGCLTSVAIGGVWTLYDYNANGYWWWE